jgi:Neisseria PilC beta-propeller domain
MKTLGTSGRAPSTIRSRPGGRAVATLLGLLSLAGVPGSRPAAAQDPDLPSAVANMELIEAGALVIPMDNTNQSVVAPFNLKAYGLVNRLLQNEIPVQWAISATKVKDGVDFTVAAERVRPTAVAPTTKAFSGGPFIVTQAFATEALAHAVAFGNDVAVFRTTADVMVDIRYDLRFKPYVGIGNVNTSIHSKIMTAAGIPGTTTCGAHHPTTCNWTMVDPLLVNSVACLTSHTDPHRDTTNEAAIRGQILAYLQSGGNFLAQCAAVRFFEGEFPTMGSYLTTDGIADDNVNTAVSYLAPNTAFSQFVGALDYAQEGSWQDGNLGTGNFKNNGHIQVKNAAANHFTAAAGKVRTGIGGNVFYLGGHEYDTGAGKPIAQINGARMVLNTVFVPPQRPASCGFNFLTPGRVTLVKDTEPDNPWFDFNFEMQGPSPQIATLQDPGSNECPGHPLCAAPDVSPAWDHNDRMHFASLEPTTSASQRYTVVETGLDDGESAELTLDDYAVTWECKNVAPPETSAVCDPGSLEFDYDACQPQAASCALDAEWSDGVISGEGTQSLPFDLCQDGHVICRFTNNGGPGTGVCLESDHAIGDLQALGGLSPDRVSFTTAAVSAPGGGSADSIFLASFVPIADQSRWAGTVDSFVQPLPVIANAEGNLVPDQSRVCADAEDTACLAWDAGVEILDQAPDATEVATDRRIGMTATERRVTYTQAVSGDSVPRSIRPFDYSDVDPVTDERDLWLGMGIAFEEGEPDSEGIARDEAQNVIRETLRERRVDLVTNPDTGELETVTYVVGDFFHGSPLMLAGPSNFFYLANDLESNGEACDDDDDPNPGYRCFFEQQRRRRRVLLAPSNDGQLHAFDAGFFQGSVVSQRLVGEFDHGTGKELFAHIPRPMLAHTRAMLTEDHDFGIDGNLVADDVFIDPVHHGTPDPDQRQWRSVVIGGYREGGRGLYALDLTQPDPVEPRNVLDFAGAPDVEYVPVAGDSEVPECSALQGNLPAGCSLPYPAALWEFQDECTFAVGTTGSTVVMPCDDDTNGYPDLASSWSKVNTGRVLVVPAGETDAEVRFVALFGGGLDPDHPGVSGNFLYLVDIETGKAIYKRELDGAVPSEPAAVDTDQNGILDTLYVGTTTGLLFKTDISTPGSLDSVTGRVEDQTQWTPFPIFDTEGRPIFFPPTVIFEANSGHFALGFGTGDREDLWSNASTGEEGRFYLILDSDFTPGIAPLALGPLTEADFEQIPFASAASAGNFLLAPVGDNLPGWVLQLGPDERLVTDALAISGLLAFTTFDPERPEVCTFGGNGKIYTLLATNANAVGGQSSQRARTVEGFAGEPVVTTEGFARQEGQGNTVDPFEATEIQAIRNSLMGLFPSDCRFGSFSLNLSSSLSTREMVPLAQIPVCIARKNWTEHF